MCGKHALEIVVNKYNPHNSEPNIQPRMIFNSGHRFVHITGWITFVILLKFVYSQQQVGDWCEYQSTNVTGQCKLLSECPGAIEGLQSQQIFPQTCGFDGVKPIVCCDSSSTNYRTGILEVLPVGRKSNQKCKEYSDQYNKNISITHIPGFPRPQQEACVHFDGFLIQGTRARSHEFPHMAAIGYEEEDNKKAWLCSGVLISEKFILTAAHCLDNPRRGTPKYIRIGDMNLDSDDDDAMPQEFNVARIFRHPEYKPRSTHNDIGLLKLDGTANFTLYARPACLYTNSTLPSLNPMGLTWGRDYSSSDSSSHLLKESLKFVSHAECESSLKSRRDKILDEKQVCAGLRFENMLVVGTGALQTYNREGHCMYDVVGIGPFGGILGNDDLPYVFTRVSAYIPWIEGIVWPS